MITLMVSRNLGVTYEIDYSCDDKDDPRLQELIAKRAEEGLRYYVDGDDSVVCRQHLVPIVIFNDGIVRTGGFKSNIEDKVARLRNRFCK